MLSMSGRNVVPRRRTLGIAAFCAAVSRRSWLSSVMLSRSVLNLSVRRAVSHTPGMISSLVRSNTDPPLPKRQVYETFARSAVEGRISCASARVARLRDITSAIRTLYHTVRCVGKLFMNFWIHPKLAVFPDVYGLFPPGSIRPDRLEALPALRQAGRGRELSVLKPET